MLTNKVACFLTSLILMFGRGFSISIILKIPEELKYQSKCISIDDLHLTDGLHNSAAPLFLHTEQAENYGQKLR